VHKGPPNCSRWTDECVNCSRGGADEAPVCSNIGFACQPKAVRCLSPAVPQGEPRKNNCECGAGCRGNILPLPLFHAALRKQAQFLTANCFPSKPQRDTTDARLQLGGTTMNDTLAAWTPRALSVLRIITGLLIIQHGMGKIIGFPAFPAYANVQPLSLIGAAGFIELIGGALLILGLFTQPWRSSWRAKWHSPISSGTSRRDITRCSTPARWRRCTAHLSVPVDGGCGFRGASMLR